MTTTFENKHNTSRFKQIAYDNLILLADSGSGLYGTSVAGGDRDEAGICIEPPECVIGLEEFQQYQWRSQPQGVRSGDGDLDLTIFGLRKWASQAAKGNPNQMLMLFIPEASIIEIKPPAIDLQRRRDMFLSRDAGKRFLGYLDSQRNQLLDLRGKHTNRPELIEIYGFDTKFAYHAVRLGLQGVELLSTGKITLPIPEPDRSWLRDVRLGKYSKADVLERIDELRFELERLTYTADIPDKVDSDKLNKWLTETYQHWWIREHWQKLYFGPALT